LQTAVEILDEIEMMLIVQYNHILNMQNRLDSLEDEILQENLNEIEDTAYELSCDVLHLRRLLI